MKDTIWLVNVLFILVNPGIIVIPPFTLIILIGKTFLFLWREVLFEKSSLEQIKLFSNNSWSQRFSLSYQDLVEIYSVSAETIRSDAFSYSENV
jgi:hypothetical protein